MRILPIAAALLVSAPLFPLAPADAEAVTKRSCLRGGATLEAAAGGTRVVRMTAKRQSRMETRRERLLACWTKTGRRVRIAEEVDFGLDNIARTRVEIVEGRYVGVRAHDEGGVSESIRARVYDARRGRLLHTSRVCDEVDQGDFGGVDDVAFLDGGGMAMTCDRLLLYRNATAELETLEPAGTHVRQLGVSRYTHTFGPRLFWTIVTPEGEVTRSRLL